MFWETSPFLVVFEETSGEVILLTAALFDTLGSSWELSVLTVFVLFLGTLVAATSSDVFLATWLLVDLLTKPEVDPPSVSSSLSSSNLGSAKGVSFFRLGIFDRKSVHEISENTWKDTNTWTDWKTVWKRHLHFQVLYETLNLKTTWEWKKVLIIMIDHRIWFNWRTRYTRYIYTRSQCLYFVMSWPI